MARTYSVKKMTEKVGQYGLFIRFHSGAKYMVPNMCYCLGEADMFLVQRNDYSHEFEVKISRSDFLADKKKKKKHCNLQFPLGGMKTPNKFSYVVPKDMIKVEEVPDYAGLYYIWHDGGISEVKAPKFLHKSKHDWTEKVAKSCSWRLLRMFLVERKPEKYNANDSPTRSSGR